MSNGSLIHVVKNLWTADLTSYYFERTRARLLYIGCGILNVLIGRHIRYMTIPFLGDGAVFAFCFRSLAILGSVRTGDKEITAIGYYCHHRTFVPVGSSNGNLRLIESVAQHELTLSSYFVLNAFGRGNSSAIGIAGIEVVEDFQLAIVLSATKLWSTYYFCFFPFV